MYTAMKASVIVALLFLIEAASASSVLNFTSYDKNSKDVFDIMEILMRHQTPERYMPKLYFQKYGISLNSRLTSFSYKNCGNPSTETAWLLELQVSPDPIRLPGVIQLAFKVVNLHRAVSPIQTDVTLWKKILGMWIQVPCMGSFGSCGWRDFCELLVKRRCPRVFIENNIPCKCPFPVGNYTLPSTAFDIYATGVPSGDFCIRVAFDSSTVSCSEIYFSLA